MYLHRKTHVLCYNTPMYLHGRVACTVLTTYNRLLLRIICKIWTFWIPRQNNILNILLYKMLFSKFLRDSRKESIRSHAGWKFQIPEAAHINILLVLRSGNMFPTVQRTSADAQTVKFPGAAEYHSWFNTVKFPDGSPQSTASFANTYYIYQKFYYNF